MRNVNPKSVQTGMNFDDLSADLVRAVNDSHKAGADIDDILVAVAVILIAVADSAGVSNGAIAALLTTIGA